MTPQPVIPRVRVGLLAGIASLLVTVSPAAAQTPLFVLDGTAAGDLFGLAVAGIGDIDNDGTPDLAVGAPQILTGPGYARVHTGPAGALRFSYAGVAAAGEFGRALAGVGDATGDGFDDFAIGAPAEGNGTVRLYSGATAAVFRTLVGDAAGDNYGFSLAGIGDLDGDSVGDLVVGIPTDDAAGVDAGAVRAVSVATGATIFTALGGAAGDVFGVAVATVGDVNGDLRDDVVVGADRADPNGGESGAAAILSGVGGAVLFSFEGDGPGDFFGVAVDRAGDVNGDSVPDAIVGARQELVPPPGAEGYARVFSGLDGSVVHTFTGDAIGDDFGFNVAGAGDLNLDGFADLAVGAPRVNSFAGLVRVFSGSDGTVLANLAGVGPLDFFGSAVARAGDLNGDSRPDLIVGATRPPAGPVAGAARAFSGFDLIPCTDLDVDGYGSPASGNCAFPAEDCDDGNAAVNPGAAENCANGVDDDCDGQVDGADPECAGGCGLAAGDGAATAAFVYAGAWLALLVAGRRRP